jgi:gamma-glutamylcyclotransferase (GGCT)/AIG2-like uncharacterized protein YtfP
MIQHFVFVYGTLRRGGPGEMSSRFPAAKFIAAAQVAGSLYDLGAYPGLVLNESNSSVLGEVYEVDDKTLNRLDEFEAGSHYRRQQVAVSIGTHRRVCWTYTPEPEFYALETLITSGDWLAYAQTKTDRPKDARADEPQR